MNLKIATTIGLLAAPVFAGDPVSVLIVGADMDACIVPGVSTPFANAGYDVSQLGSVAALDAADLSTYDVVWLTNGISSSNPGCSGADPIPSAIGEDKLAGFVQGGGGLFLAGEAGTEVQLDYLLWRDAFVSDRLLGGAVVGTCFCEIGNTVYIDPSSTIASIPNTVTSVQAGSVFTGAFDAVGTGSGFAFGAPDLSGLPVAVAWDAGDLGISTTGRLVTYNNSNNGAGFELLAVNIVAFLSAETCPADLAAPMGVLNFFDVAAFIAAYNTMDPSADLAAPAGVFNFFDVAEYITQFNAGCP